MKWGTVTGFLCLIMVLGCSWNVAPVHAATVEAVYGTTPTIDGVLSPGEWADAFTFTFPGPNEFCTTYIKQDGSNLYIGINIPDITVDFPVVDEFRVCLDINDNHGIYPHSDDYLLRVSRPMFGWDQMEFYGNGITWFEQTVSGWSGAGTDAVIYYQVELSISYSKLGVTAGVPKMLGIEFCVDDISTATYYWTGSNIYDPSTWGDITSTDDLWVPWFTSVPMVLLASVALFVFLRRRSPPRHIPF